MCNEDTEVCKCKYKFTSEHPGHGYSYLKKRKHPIILVASMKAGMLCNIEYLKLHEESNIDEEVVQLRENYALFANMLFLPFRELEDLKDDGGSFWGKFKQAFNATEEERNDSISINGSTLWQYGKKILQNIQDRITIEKLKRINDPLKQGTKLPVSLSTKENEKRTEDTNTIDIDSFYPAEDSNDDVLQPLIK